MKTSRLWIGMAAVAILLAAVAVWGEMNRGVRPAGSVVPAGQESTDPARSAKPRAPEPPPQDEGALLVG